MSKPDITKADIAFWTGFYESDCKNEKTVLKEREAWHNALNYYG